MMIQAKKNLTILPLLALTALLLYLSTNSAITKWLCETPFFLAAWAFRGIGFSLAMILIIFSYGVGFWFERLFQLKINEEKIVWSTSIRIFGGIAVSGILIYILGFLQLLSPLLCVVLVGLGVSSLLFDSDNFKSFFSTLQLSKLDRFEKTIWFFVILFLLSRLIPVLHFNSFGDPLYYNLPSGRDYLQAGGFRWFEYEELYSQAGFADIFLIYLHSLSSHPLLLQIAAQSFYFLLGLVLQFCLLFEFFASLIQRRHAVWMALSLISIQYLRLEAIVAKPDYLMGVLFIQMILALANLVLCNNEETRDKLLKSLLLLASLSLATKFTSLIWVLPLGIIVLSQFYQQIPISNRKFLIFLAFCFSLATINFYKNYYIFKNPVFPLANGFFNSPYWDSAGSLGNNQLFQLSGGESYDYYLRPFKILLGNPTSILMIILSLMGLQRRYAAKNRESHKTLPEKRLLKASQLIWFCWLGAMMMWYFILPPTTFLRFIIGLVFLTLLLPYFFALATHAGFYQQTKQVSITLTAWLSLVFSIGVSNSGLDWLELKHLLSNQPFQQHWIESKADIAEVQHYLNQIAEPTDVLLFRGATQRLNANFIVFAARAESLRSRFTRSNSEEEIWAGLKKTNAKYYALKKSLIATENQLLTQRPFLDENLVFLKEFNAFVLYKVKN